MTVSAIVGNARIRETRPYSKVVQSLKQRAHAINEAVVYLDRGSYFAADTVTKLEAISLRMAGDLMELHDLIVGIDDTVQQVNEEENVDFEPAADNIRQSLVDGNPSVEALVVLIEREITRGFERRSKRVQSRDDLLARIVLTADISLRMAEAARDYKSLDWEVLMGYANDLAVLGRELDLPAQYVEGFEQTIEEVQARKKTLDELLDPGLGKIAEPAAADSTEADSRPSLEGD